MWRGKDISNIVFLDRRKKVLPTIVGDAKHLPFIDKIFDKIYCDPPHMIRSDVKSRGKNPKIHTIEFFDTYGWFNKRIEWIVFIGRTNIEFARVLKDNGLLWYKIIDGKDRRITKLQDINYMDNFTIVEKEAVRPPKQKWRKNTTYELTMRKKIE